jgi:uncharacterized cupredoxin-like copper-binding protein
MSQPTDADANRELRSAGKLFAALAVGFLAVSGTSIALAAGATKTATEAIGVVAGVPAAEVVTTSSSTTTTTAPRAADPDAVQIKMGEFSFAPGSVSVPVGMPVTFFVTNVGVVDHELVIGDSHAQDEAEAAMGSGGGHAAHGASGHHGDDVPSIYLRPGESGKLTATFAKNGELLIGCHVPGHWVAGMRGTLRIG